MSAHIFKHSLCRYKFVQGDVIWTKENAFRYPLLCLWAGVAAGLLGRSKAFLTYLCTHCMTSLD